MKKFLALTLVLLLSFSLIACSPAADKPADTGGDKPADTGGDKPADPPPAGDGATISVQVEESWQPYYEQVKEKVLADNPGATINFIVSGSFDHLDTIDKTDANNTDVADVFAYPLDRFYGLHQNEILAAFDSAGLANKIGGWSNYQEGFAKYLKDGDEYFGIPMNLEALLVFVNKANAEEIGVDYSKPVEFTELGPNTLMTALFNAWYGVAFTNPAQIELLGKDDDTFFSDFALDWSELPADKQATVEAMFNYFEGHKTDKVWDKEAVWGEIDAQVATGGDTAFVIEGPWNAGKYSEIIGEDLEVMPLSNITINGKPLSHWRGGWAYGINARIEEEADKLALAESFLAEALNPENAVEFYKVTGKIMENATAQTYADSDLDEVNKQVIATVYDGFETAVDRPLFSEWGSVWETYENALLSWKSAAPADAEAAYKLIQDSFESLMGQIGQ